MGQRPFRNGTEFVLCLQSAAGHAAHPGESVCPGTLLGENVEEVSFARSYQLQVASE